MVKIVKAEKKIQKKLGGPSKLCVEDQILMTLSYLREYPTFFHLGIKWEALVSQHGSPRW
ncbi:MULTISPECIES: helix-turn-helix domain-containing protein [unclassified Tychonema]|uniref:helix-turn-helix domain-containing protein n=1 Tax=unclassified Tychonema TaxID=2642144 RepID=UPI001D157EA2